mmetsp:Transcript_74938/g.165783  ORF Transcript_74938/g.165783 Transcript_74938/m.165783 type:complete len:250 (+) Transcript_74938:223-972(+)
MALAGEATLRRGELERPQKVGGLLEVRPHRIDLVDQVLHAMEAILTKGAGDDLVVRERDALLIHLAKSALVDELPDALERGVSIGDIGLDSLQHLEDGLVHLEKDAIVELLQAQKLEHLAWLRAELDDTHDADHKQQLGLGLHEEVPRHLGLTTQGHELFLVRRVLLVILQGAHLQVVALLGAQLLLRSHCLLLLLRERRIPLELQLHLLRHNSTLGHGVLGDLIPLCHACLYLTPPEKRQPRHREPMA